MSELLTSLGIDWRLLVAQIVNFGILVFLITRFLYKPILRMLDERKARIQENENTAHSLQDRLEAIKDTEKMTLEEARKKSEEIISAADKSAKQLKANLLAEASKEVEKILGEGKKAIEADRKKLLADFRKELSIVIAASIEKTIGDVIDDGAEKKLHASALSVAEERFAK